MVEDVEEELPSVSLPGPLCHPLLEHVHESLEPVRHRLVGEPDDSAMRLLVAWRADRLPVVGEDGDRVIEKDHCIVAMPIMS